MKDLRKLRSWNKDMLKDVLNNRFFKIVPVIISLSIKSSVETIDRTDPAVVWEDSDHWGGLSDLHFLFPVCSSSVTAHIPGCAPVETVLFISCWPFTVVRGEMCVFSQTCVKAEAQGNGLRVGEGGHTMHRQQRLERSQQAFSNSQTLLCCLCHF